MYCRIWLITGISSGLGKALAESVMAKDDFVIGTFRKQSQVDEFNKKHAKSGYGLLLDITDQKGIEEHIEMVISKFGRIDILVNNAGIGFAGAVEETSMDEVRIVFNPNFFGTLKMTQAVLPYMRKEKKGHIVQISSHGGIKAFAGFGIYNASKFALEGLSEALAQEVLPLGIHVSIVEPGPFRTKFAGEGLRFAKNKMDDYAETAGVFRSKLKAVNGLQEGDPVKASTAIINHVDSKNPTLRLPLGKVAVRTIRMKLENVISDLEINRKIAENVVY
ncbi:oxidoreductase [Aquimarina sp. RZ0]|uniref:oxidoreductase n=1 Tax=Aquimarina sp. RZ0 TaxID=2607730 RepID=UPI0011F1ABAF|nr:oxidoreductase [Aquimarina sp. RZ0]KAA1246239.1 SDR family NAD(P)-dependent oxidoreductase [Aquimarina sp. RZ0]